MRSLRYGPEFSYDEFLVAPNRLAAALTSLTVFALGICLGVSSTVRGIVVNQNCTNILAVPPRLGGCLSVS